MATLQQNFVCMLDMRCARCIFTRHSITSLFVTFSTCHMKIQLIASLRSIQIEGLLSSLGDRLLDIPQLALFLLFFGQSTHGILRIRYV